MLAAVDDPLLSVLATTYILGLQQAMLPATVPRLRAADVGAAAFLAVQRRRPASTTVAESADLRLLSLLRAAAAPPLPAPCQQQQQQQRNVRPRLGSAMLSIVC